MRALALALSLMLALPAMAQWVPGPDDWADIYLPPQSAPWDRDALVCVEFKSPALPVLADPESLSDCARQAPGTTRRIVWPEIYSDWIRAWAFYDIAGSLPPVPPEIQLP